MPFEIIFLIIVFGYRPCDENDFCSRLSNNHSEKDSQFNKIVQDGDVSKTVVSIQNEKDSHQMKKNNPEQQQKNANRIGDRIKEAEKKIFLGFSAERTENFNTFGFLNRLDQEHPLEDQE